MKKQLIRMPLLRTQWNHAFIDTKYERNEEPSQTVPHMAYSLREILEKFSTGQSLAIHQNGSYEEDPDTENINPMSQPDFDLSDITELKNTLPKRIETLQKLTAKGRAKTEGKTEGAEQSKAEEAKAEAMA